MRISKKFLSIVLSVLMAVSMMPFTAFTAFAAPAPTYAQYKNTTTVITFDEKDWYLIDYDSTTVTLLSKECVGKSAYNSSGSFVTYDNNPTVKEAVDTWYSSNITENAKTAVADNKAFILESINGINSDVLKCNQVAGTYSNLWWLCSQGTSGTRAKCVDGDVGYLDDRPANWEQSVRPALKLDLSKVEFDSETKTFALPAPADVKPTATVTEVPISVVEQYFPGSNLDVAYQFVANNDGSDKYKTYNADFVVSFDKAVPQGAVRLFGQYGNYPLTECPITKDLAANEEYRLLKDAMGMDMTYQQILDLVGTFYCGAQYTAAAAGATMTIKLAIYETAVDPETGDVTETGTEVEIDDAEQTDTAPALPQAVVTDITDTEENELGLDKAVKFVAPQEESAYDDELCDFAITFDQDVTSNDIELWGNYGAYGWVNLNSEASGEVVTFEAGKTYYLLKDIVKWPMTYAQIRDNVGTFKCGLNCKLGAAGVTTDVQLVLFPEPEEGEEPVPADIGDVEEYVAPALPQATVTDITNTEENELGLDAAYKFEAPAGTSAYDDEYCDFIVRFDQDVTSDDIELWGKYGEYDWTNLASEASGDAYTFEAGKDYYLLRDVIKWPMTYAQIRQIGTFYCGVNSYYGANGATMNVELALYEEPAEGEEPAPVVLDDEEFVAPDKPDPATQDEISITTADEIDVNLYLAETGEEATVEYTFNTTPDIQEDTQGTKTVDFNSLPKVAGKRKLTIRVAPAQIKDNIDIKIKNNSGNVVRSYENYSVAEYCDELIAGNYSNAVKTLAKSVLDYGKAASAFFGYNENAFANQTYNFEDFTFDTTGFTATATDIDVTAVRYVATSVPSLRFVVDMTEADAERYTAETDKGYAAKFVKVGDDVILQVTGIPAAKLGETIKVSVKDAQEDVVGTIEYTPLVFAYMATKDTTTPGFARLGETIGQYATAANAVFA